MLPGVKHMLRLILVIYGTAETVTFTVDSYNQLFFAWLRFKVLTNTTNRYVNSTVIRA